jgi:hypothetical protein
MSATDGSQQTNIVSVFVRATGRGLTLKAGQAYLAQATAKARRKVGLF